MFNTEAIKEVIEILGEEKGTRLANVLSDTEIVFNISNSRIEVKTCLDMNNPEASSAKIEARTSYLEDVGDGLFKLKNYVMNVSPGSVDIQEAIGEMLLRLIEGTEVFNPVLEADLDILEKGLVKVGKNGDVYYSRDYLNKEVKGKVHRANEVPHDGSILDAN